MTLGRTSDNKIKIKTDSPKGLRAVECGCCQSCGGCPALADLTVSSLSLTVYDGLTVPYTEGYPVRSTWADVYPPNDVVIDLVGGDFWAGDGCNRLWLYERRDDYLSNESVIIGLMVVNDPVQGCGFSFSVTGTTYYDDYMLQQNGTGYWNGGFFAKNLSELLGTHNISVSLSWDRQDYNEWFPEYNYYITGNGSGTRTVIIS